MNHKFSEVLHSTFSILAFLGVMGLSSFVVVNMNPIAVIEDTKKFGPEVAGISTSFQSLNFINTAKESATYKTQIEKSPGSMTYKARFHAANGEIRDDFIKVQNTSDNDGAFLIEAQVPSELKNQVSIKIQDLNDIITLENLSPRRITVSKRSEKVFRIKYNFNKSVNYNFEINFKIQN